MRKGAVPKCVYTVFTTVRNMVPVGQSVLLWLAAGLHVGVHRARIRTLACALCFS